MSELLSAWAANFPLAVYYDLRDDGTDPSNGEHNFGLVQNDYGDKPAVVAVRTLSAAARARTFAGFVPMAPSSLHAMRLEGAADSAVVLWTEAPAAVVPVTVSGAPAVTDVFGSPVQLDSDSNGVRRVVVREADGPLYLTYTKASVTDGGADGADATPPAPDGGSNTGGAPSGTGGSRASGGAVNAGGSRLGGGLAAGAGGTHRAAAASPFTGGCACRTTAGNPPAAFRAFGLCVTALLLARRGLRPR